MRRSQSQTFKSARAITNTDAKIAKPSDWRNAEGPKPPTARMRIEILVITPLGVYIAATLARRSFD